MERYNVNIGDIICDANYKHQRVVWINGDTVGLEDGSEASIKHDLDPADHIYTHPTDDERLKFRLDNPHLIGVEW